MNVPMPNDRVEPSTGAPGLFVFVLCLLSFGGGMTVVALSHLHATRDSVSSEINDIARGLGLVSAPAPTTTMQTVTYTSTVAQVKAVEAAEQAAKAKADAAWVGLAADARDRAQENFERDVAIEKRKMLLKRELVVIDHELQMLLLQQQYDRVKIEVQIMKLASSVGPNPAMKDALLEAERAKTKLLVEQTKRQAEFIETAKRQQIEIIQKHMDDPLPKVVGQ